MFTHCYNQNLNLLDNANKGKILCHLQRNRLFAILFALFIPQLSFALSSDRNEPMFIDAQYLKNEGNKQANESTVTYLKGNVQLSQGSIKGQSDEATIYQDSENKNPPPKANASNSGDSKIKRVLMLGKPAHLEQMQDNGGGLMTASADQIDYQVVTDMVEMTGNVVVIQANRGEFRGAHMTYNTKTGEMQSGDEHPESRVHLRMMPKPKTDTEKKPTSKDTQSPK